MQSIKNSFVFDATTTSLTAPIFENGIITNYTLVCPNFTNAVTSTLSILDDDGVTIWTGDAKNENATYLVSSLSVPVDKGYTLKATLSGVAGAGGGTVVAKLFVDQRN